MFHLSLRLKHLFCGICFLLRGPTAYHWVPQTSLHPLECKAVATDSQVASQVYITFSQTFYDGSMAQISRTVKWRTPKECVASFFAVHLLIVCFFCRSIPIQWRSAQVLQIRDATSLSSHLSVLHAQGSLSRCWFHVLLKKIYIFMHWVFSLLLSLF